MPKQEPTSPLPLPPHYDPLKVGEVWRVPYQERAQQAETWKVKHSLQPASQDKPKVALLLVDVQNTFCIPGFELFVGGRSGMGAVEDNRRLCEFIYRNLGAISHITASLDTHHAMQIFHPIFLVNGKGEHPGPATQVTSQDIRRGTWCFNPAIAPSLGITPQYGQQQLQHYVDALLASSKYDLTIWPYHAMLGGIGHALVSAVEEALFFYTIARTSQVQFEIKGDQSLTEHYSILRPEVMSDAKGKALGRSNGRFLQLVKKYDRLVIAGQAKSHCVAFTITDLLEDIRAVDESLAGKVYLLEDCMSPVVIRGVVDYTEQAEQAFRGFQEAGMHLVRSSDPLDRWPG
jgi:nicotinamidase-related amidase